MNRKTHSKSGLFLMELLMNLLLFCLLCGCGLLFFIKSHNLTNDATALHQAVSITTSVAGVYETGDGSLDSIQKLYTNADPNGKYLYLYLDENYLPCSKDQMAYYVIISQADHMVEKIQIEFCRSNGEVLYSICACNLTATTLGTAKEVVGQ